MTKVDIMNKQINDYIYSKKSEILQNLAELVVIPSVKGTPENGAPFEINRIDCGGLDFDQ